jgi:hypothetical protein
MRWLRLNTWILAFLALVETACLPAPILGSPGVMPAQGDQREISAIEDALRKAQRFKDERGVWRLSQALSQALGLQAGVPQVHPVFKPVARNTALLSPQELRAGFDSQFDRQREPVRSMAAHPPQKPEDGLRFPAVLLNGLLAAYRAGDLHSAQFLEAARELGSYLMWAQDKGKRGLFPFPDLRGTSYYRAFVADYIARKATEGGRRVSDVMVNGWFVDDSGFGDLQFDNGIAGDAMLSLYEATRDPRYLDSARRAADWAVRQPAVLNWNYNAFTVMFLAHAYRLTGDGRYLDSAKEKTRLGIYPGQLRSGPNRGRWMDGHNASVRYHWAIIRGLGSLAAVLKPGDRELPRLFDVLSLALQTGTADILERGVYDSDGIDVNVMLDTLCCFELMQPFAYGAIPEANRRSQALDLLGRSIAATYRSGQLQLPSDTWGRYLEVRTRQTGQSAPNA